MSLASLARQLKKLGFKSNFAAIAQYLDEGKAQRRLAWCTARRTLTEVDFQKWALTDGREVD